MRLLRETDWTERTTLLVVLTSVVFAIYATVRLINL